MSLDSTGNFSDENQEEAEIELYRYNLSRVIPTLYRYYQSLKPEEQRIFDHLCFLEKDPELVAQQLGLERIVVEGLKEKVSDFFQTNFSAIAEEHNSKIAERNRQLEEIGGALKRAADELYIVLYLDINNN